MSGFDEEDIEDDVTNYKPSYVLIAIDTHPSMFVKRETDDDSDTTPFKECVNACYRLADSLILCKNRRSWSPFGVALAREDNAASFVDFDSNVLNSVKFLKDKTVLSSDKLRDKYQRKGTFDLASFFLFCKKKFKQISSVYYKRTIIFITNDDDPINGDKNQRFAALNEAKNFEANDITFELVTMNPKFDYTKFYNELFSLLTVRVENLAEDEEGLLEKLSSSIVLRYFQRRLNFFPFPGDDKRFLRVVSKNLISSEHMYNDTTVSAQGELVKRIEKGISSMQKSYELHSPVHPIELQEEDVLEIKRNELPVGYTLLFVSDRVTEVGFVLDDPALLQLDDKEDLVQHYESFWQYCVNKNKVLICVKKLRKLDKIRYVELIPKFINNAKMFLIKNIPFADEINPTPTCLKQKSTRDFSSQEIQVMKDLINPLTFDYDVRMFANPIVAKKIAYFKAKLLDEAAEDVEDVALNDAEINKSLGGVIGRFHALFGDGVPAPKRKAPASKATTSRAKKAKS